LSQKPKSVEQLTVKV